VRNKARFVAQGFSQLEGLNFGETFALFARVDAIKILPLLRLRDSNSIK
jgi:hypothetical protein